MIRPLAALLLVLSLLAGCGSTPPTQVYGFTPATPRPVTPAPAGAPLVFVDPAEVAEYADRTQMVTRSGDYRVSLHEFSVWSEPPGQLVAASLVDDLALRFGDDRVMVTPIPRYADPDWRVELKMLRFDVDASGQAVIDVRWTLLKGAREDQALSRRELIVTTATPPDDADARVAALRQGLAELAQRIGDAIAAGGR